MYSYNAIEDNKVWNKQTKHWNIKIAEKSSMYST